MRAPETRFPGPARLSGKAGHRFIWDLRHNGVPGMRGMQGPIVAPGDCKPGFPRRSYGRAAAQVVSDPRLAKDGVTDAMIAEQTKLCSTSDRESRKRGRFLRKLNVRPGEGFRPTAAPRAARVKGPSTRSSRRFRPRAALIPADAHRPVRERVAHAGSGRPEARRDACTSASTIAGARSGEGGGSHDVVAPVGRWEMKYRVLGRSGLKVSEISGP